jgi:transposase
MVKALQCENEQLKTEVKVLSLRVKVLEKELYGSRADRRTPEDPKQGTFAGIDMDDQAHEANPPASSPKRKKERTGKKKGPKPLDPDLPRVDETVADPGLKALICPLTGYAMKPVFTETIEVLARKPAEHYVRRITRQVFASPDGEAMAYSPWPCGVLPKSRIDVSVIANLLTSRFADHQPYHRQSGQLKRHGVTLASNTMVSLVRLACEKLQPIYNAIRKQTLATAYLMMDPTPVPLQSKSKKGGTKEAALWTYRALDGPVFFEFATSKRGITPAQTLNDYQGILQTDGASNFGGVPSRPGVIAMNCWAHVRRYFVKAEDAGEPAAKDYLDPIDRLFRIEKLARYFRLKPGKIKKLRYKHSLPLVDALFERAKQYAIDQRLLKTPLPKAVKYVLGRTKELRECFLHAPSRIDNNLAENALRPIKLGAKNWLFIGHENAGPRTAMMFTLVENCRMLGINPEAYFIDVLAKVDDHPNARIEELTPSGWKSSKNS